MKIERTHDIEWLNWMMNHPAIRPFIGDDSIVGRADISALVVHDNYFFRVTMNGQPSAFVAMLRLSAGIYEMHSGFLPDYRGRFVITTLNECVDRMFAQDDCLAVNTWGFSTSKHALFVARIAGFMESGRRAWPNTVNGKLVDYVSFILPRELWKFLRGESQKTLSSCHS